MWTQRPDEITVTEQKFSNSDKSTSYRMYIGFSRVHETVTTV